MMGAAGTKQRIVERNRYREQDNVRGYRDARVNERGEQVTLKKRGDKVIHANGRVETVKYDGWF